MKEDWSNQSNLIKYFLDAEEGDKNDNNSLEGNETIEKKESPEEEKEEKKRSVLPESFFKYMR